MIFFIKIIKFNLHIFSFKTPVFTSYEICSNLNIYWEEVRSEDIFYLRNSFVVPRFCVAKDFFPTKFSVGLR